MAYEILTNEPVITYEVSSAGGEINTFGANDTYIALAVLREEDSSVILNHSGLFLIPNVEWISVEEFFLDAVGYVSVQGAIITVDALEANQISREGKIYLNYNFDKFTTTYILIKQAGTKPGMYILQTIDLIDSFSIASLRFNLCAQWNQIDESGNAVAVSNIISPSSILNTVSVPVTLTYYNNTSIPRVGQEPSGTKTLTLSLNTEGYVSTLKVWTGSSCPSHYLYSSGAILSLVYPCYCIFTINPDETDSTKVYLPFKYMPEIQNSASTYEYKGFKLTNRIFRTTLTS